MSNLHSIVGQKVTSLDVTEKFVSLYTESGAQLTVDLEAGTCKVEE